MQIAGSFFLDVQQIRDYPAETRRELWRVVELFTPLRSKLQNAEHHHPPFHFPETTMAPPVASSQKPASGTGTRVVLPPPTTNPTVASDAGLLLDAYDKFTSGNRLSSGQGNAAPTSGQANADPIEFLNRHYRTEPMLVTMLPEIREELVSRMNRLDDRISGALQRQSEQAEATQRYVQDAKASVGSLEQRIRQLQEKASQSETAVREITKDMKQLDSAKRHLQRTITTLKRLHMLVHAVEQLRLACLRKPFPDYSTAAHLVDATRLLLKHFDAYSNKVEPIKLLSQRVKDLHGELHLSLVHGFRVVGFGLEKALELEKKNKKKSLLTDEEEGEEEGAKNLIMTPDVMAGGTLLIDSLGSDIRKEFITTFGQDFLAEYNSIFQPVRKPAKVQQRVSSFKATPEPPKEDAKSESGLDMIERRFMWFRELIQEVEQKYPKVFPHYWNLQYFLTRFFLKLVSTFYVALCGFSGFASCFLTMFRPPFDQTRNHLLAMLGGPVKDADADNATTLLKALQKTILFEKEVTAALQREYGTVFIGMNEDGKPTSNGMASKREETKTTRGTSSDDGRDASEEEGRASTKQEPVEPLLRMASSAYDNYMGPYIALEEKNMDEQLVESLEDRTVDTRGELPVFTTSTKLFVYIKGSITRCTALTKGYAFFLLYQAFQDSLRKYSQVLSSKLPAQIPQSSGGLSLGNVQFGKQEGNSGTTTSYRVPKGEEVTVCHVIGTCEYCADTVEALEDLIRDTIEDEYRPKVDMMGQQEAFHEITAKAIRILVSGLENRLEDALKLMSSVNWGTFDEVGEESDYVRYMHREIQPYVTTSRGLIPTPYFRSFCDKFALSFTNTYYDTLIRLKRISEPGTQQLLLDVYNLKTLFLKLPVLESSAASSTSPNRRAVPAGSTIAPKNYTKMVQKQFKRIETLLKLTGTPADMLIDVFKVQWVGGSALDLQTVMYLKGMKRQEQAAMLEKFGLDPVTALRGATHNISGATIVSERLQAVQDSAARVNSDLNQMRQKVDDFRKSFR